MAPAFLSLSLCYSCWVGFVDGNFMMLLFKSHDSHCCPAQLSVYMVQIYELARGLKRGTIFVFIETYHIHAQHWAELLEPLRILLQAEEPDLIQFAFDFL